MRIVFRTDASIQIGTGHVMRCLTLADELTRQGSECTFICREHPGHLGNLIVSKGHRLTLLPAPIDSPLEPNSCAADDYALWLGVPWQEDARDTLDLISDWKPDWLVVDHYALDAQWERALLNAVGDVMVIDDLVNRSHDCTLLLDQTFGRSAKDYRTLVPDTCHILCGSQYALLRPEFAELRPCSLQRRSNPVLSQLLITMGGVDKDNVTGRVLDALRESELPRDCRIVVVLGATAPWLKAVKQQAKDLPWSTEVKENVSNMAQVMAESDLAIGAAGATSWERCCLGLPSILIIIAANQYTVASNLQQSGAAVCLPSNFEKINLNDAMKILDIKEMSHNSSLVCSGIGVKYVCQKMAVR